VKSAISEGLRQTEALLAYREGGGAIRTSLWGDLWKRYQSGVETWDAFYTLKGSDSIPESFFVETDINYKNTYNYAYRVEGIDIDGNIRSSKYGTITSNRRLTVTQLSNAITEDMESGITDIPLEVRYIREIEFLRRS
jgi:hypothetical protein